MTSYPQNVIDELVKIDKQGMKLSDQAEHIGWSEYHIMKARKELGLHNLHNYHVRNASKHLLKLIELSKKEAKLKE